MIHGVDTDFLVAVEVKDHPFHPQADALLTALLKDGHDLALAPQTLAEFVHVVTDGRRMPQPLSLTEAISRAEHWWQAAEVVRVFPDGRSVTDFIEWRCYITGLDFLTTAQWRCGGKPQLLAEHDCAVFDVGPDDIAIDEFAVQHVEAERI